MFVAKLSLVLSLAIVLLCACEGNRYVRGVVKDKNTGRLLDSVLCHATTSGMKVVTDSTGHFEVRNPRGGCIPDCKDIVVQFTRMGYKMLEVVNPSDTIFYLQKQ